MPQARRPNARAGTTHRCRRLAAARAPARSRSPPPPPARTAPTGAASPTSWTTAQTPLPIPPPPPPAVRPTQTEARDSRPPLVPLEPSPPAPAPATQTQPQKPAGAPVSEHKTARSCGRGSAHGGSGSLRGSLLLPSFLARFGGQLLGSVARSLGLHTSDEAMELKLSEAPPSAKEPREQPPATM
jgi:hypothetical protein